MNRLLTAVSTINLILAGILIAAHVIQAFSLSPPHLFYVIIIFTHLVVLPSMLSVTLIIAIAALASARIEAWVWGYSFFSVVIPAICWFSSFEAVGFSALQLA